MSRLLLLGLVVLPFGAGFLQACSATGDGFDAGKDATTKDVVTNETGLPPLDASNDETGSDAASDAPNPDLACIYDDAGCDNCCFNNHTAGIKTYLNALLACACTQGATCHSASVCLNNLCKGNVPSPTCDNCLSNPDAGDCYAKSDTACNGDPDCVAFNVCSALCTPPPTDGGADATSD